MRECYFPEKKCETCGKTFIPAPYHRFKVAQDGKRAKYYCCYTCYLHREIKKNKNKKPVSMMDETGKVIAEFSGAKEASIYLAGKGMVVDFPILQTACRLHRKYYGYLWSYKEV